MSEYDINKLLERYYSGIITPKEYQELLSAMDSAQVLLPDLEVERKIFMAIHKCDISVPENLEHRLSNAIDRRSRRFHNTIKAFVASAAIAIGIIFITFAGYFTPSQPDTGISDEELWRRAENVDAALRSALSGLSEGQNAGIECVEEIKITQNLNI